MAKKARVLIVDDDLDMRTTLKDIIENEGNEVILAQDGSEALKKARESHIDIAIIDMVLPVVMGSDLQSNIKRIYPNVAAVLMTGHRNEMEDLVRAAMRNGACACLYKPFDPKVVVSIIKEIESKGSDAKK